MAGRKRTASRALRRKGKRLLRRWKRRANKKQVRNRVSVPVGLGFPKRLVMTHKYCEQFSLSTAAGGAVAVYSWNCNSLYDPNSSGVGHQPMYFDQVAALYDHYVVVGSMAIFRLQKTDSLTGAPTTVGVYINDDSTAVTPLTSILEQSQGKHRVLTVANPNVRIVKKWSAKKAFGGSILANTELQGTPSANPTEVQCFTLFVDSSIGAQVTTVQVDVEIRYIAVWKELKDITGS